MTHRPISPLLVPQGLFAALAAVLASQPAMAHGSAAGGVFAGFWHPLSGGDHLLLLIAVGLAAASLSPQLLAWALVGGLAGGVFGALGGGVPAAEVLAALAIPAVASLVLLQRRGGQPPALGIGGALIAITVALHAMLHGQEASGTASWWLGALMASALSIGLSFAAGRQLSLRQSQLAAGLLVLLGGVLALAPL